MLQKRGRLDLHLTALELGVSDMTVRRDFRRRVLRHYAAAACVAMVLGVATYWAVPPTDEPEMRLAAHVERQYVTDTINGMLHHQTLA